MYSTNFIDGDVFERLAAKYGLSYAETDKVRPRELSGKILTHNSDGCILPAGRTIQPILYKTRIDDYNWSNVPASVRVWFAQNVDVRDIRLVPIPIGLERDRWSPKLNKKQVLSTLPDKGKSGLLYLNFSTRTNWIRSTLYEYFKNLEWCTSERRVGFTDYARQVKRHKFVLCPEGNGFDTHRTWEALYLGSYPIVLRRVFTIEFAKKLPILVVDNWSEVTEQKLNEAYLSFKNREWTWEALTANYWERLLCQRLQKLS